MKQFLFLSLGVLVLFSCSDLKKQDQIKAIDQLSIAVDSIQEIVLQPVDVAHF